MERSYSKTDSTPKKRKSKAQEENVEKSKKPRSAYLLYYFDVYQVMQMTAPNMPQSEMNKRISESWKRLSVSEKSYYLEKARMEKEGHDTSSLSPSKDPPGFRKILPRASYYIMSKGSSSSSKSEGFESEVSVESLQSPSEGDVSHEALALAAELELSESPLIGQDIELETVSPPLDLHTLPSSSSSSEIFTQLISTDSQSCDQNTSQTRGSCVLPNVLQTLAEPGQMVAFIPSQPVKTYTRRGRGRCQNSGCSFVYLSRHKPTTCPDCGSHLGGKWVPAAKRIQQKAASNQQPPQAGSRSTDSRTSHLSNADKGLNKDAQSRKEQSQTIYKVESTASQTPSHDSSSQRKMESQLNALRMDGEKREEVSPSSSSSSTDTFRAADSHEFTSSKVSFKTQGTDSTCGKTQTPAVISPPQPGTTYTRRGRGRCHNPECSFVYVSRHKPSACPDCGIYLGGKKNNSERKTQQNKSLSSLQRSSDGNSSKKTLQTKNPVRPILPACSNSALTLFHIITVPPEKTKHPNNKASSDIKGTFPGLKPSTLRQLGQAVPKQECVSTDRSQCVSTDRSQRVLSLTDKSLNILPVMPYKHNTVSTFDLGLSTSRGRGCCKNPSCKYIYKNRHKPAVCPVCGCGLTQKNFKSRKSETLLDPFQALSPAQKEIQKQNTVQLLRSSLQMPESESDSQDMLNFIRGVNQLQIVLVEAGDEKTCQTVSESGWPLIYESAATYCGVCRYPLFKGGQSSVAGLEDCRLLTETLMHKVSLQHKVCLNAECLALHSFTDLHPGLFNIGNKLLVTLDLFLKIRASIKVGVSPSEAVRTLLDHNPDHPVHLLSQDESSQIQDLLLSGYWAFESLTLRDYNDMICGICGISPKMEISQRHTDNVLELKHVEFTWPEDPVSDEVHVDDFWLTMENEAIEQAAFPSDVPITRVDASIIAPFTPPLMRSGTVINTEKDKLLSHTPQLSGDPSVLVRLIHDGELRLSTIEEHTEEELRSMTTRCSITTSPTATKTDLLACLLSFCTHVQSGLPTGPQPPPHRTAGTLSKLCPHKVVCSSKYLVRGETARDHVDLLLSSRYWPPVYVCDSAHQVALCTDMQYPELATQMWGRNQGCFCDPLDKPEVVWCSELQEQMFSSDLSLVTENLQVHPVTKSSSCWMVRPPSEDQNPPSVKDQNPPSLGDQNPPSVEDQNPPSVEDQNPPSVEDQNPPSVKDQNPPSVKDQNPPSVEHQNPPSVKDQNPPSVKDQNPPSVKDQNPPSVKDQNPQSVEDQNPPSVEDQNPPSVEDQNPPSVEDQNPPSVEHHSMFLCRDLEPYVSQVQQLQRSGSQHVVQSEDRGQNGGTTFSNAAYYYLYNRLKDFLSSRDIVNHQINRLVDTCQMGEVVIRDALYRLGVAQIKTEEDTEVRK